MMENGEMGNGMAMENPIFRDFQNMKAIGKINKGMDMVYCT